MAMNERKTETVSEALELDMVGDRYPYSDGMSPAACAVKRLFDVVASLTGLIVVSPVMLVVSWLIKREDGGPVGKPELCHKDDRRLTRVGRFLREHHLDEIPQLWNVLKGEMSFVGPRPERAFFVEKIRKINPDYDLLYKLRPGLFSPATLYNGYTDTMEKMLQRLRMDLDYLANRSLWLDLKIIYLTVTSILLGKKF